MIDYDSLPYLILTLLLLVGLVGLCLGGDWLARGASSLALIWKVNPVVVGLTIVSIATSMPELITALMAASKGNSGLAVGNIIGSNLGNVGLILGVTALITPVVIQWRLIRQEVPILFIATLVFTFLCLQGYMMDGTLGRIGGGILLVGAIAYLVFLTVQAKRSQRGLQEEISDELSDALTSQWKCYALILAGGFALWLGAELLVNSSVVIASRLHISNELIGLTIVAIGTSLPELAASIAAARRKHSDIIAGNIVGSNIFNMLLVGGGTAALFPLKLDPRLFIVEFPAMLILTVLLWVAFFSERKVTRKEGCLFLILYALIMTLSALSQQGILTL